MKYLEALQKILSGMSNDNAIEIECGAQMLITLVGDVPLIGAERKLAAHLIQRAADVATVCPVHGLKLIDGYCPSLTCRYSPPRR